MTKDPIPVNISAEALLMWILLAKKSEKEFRLWILLAKKKRKRISGTKNKDKKRLKSLKKIKPYVRRSFPSLTPYLPYPQTNNTWASSVRRPRLPQDPNEFQFGFSLADPANAESGIAFAQTKRRKFENFAVVFKKFKNYVSDLQRHFGDFNGVPISVTFRQSRSDHISVSDSFNLK